MRRAALDPALIKAHFVDIAMHFGFNSVFAGWVPPANRYLRSEEVAEQVLLNTMPAPWYSRYVERGYVFRDPIVRRLHNESAPFTWNEAYLTCTERRDLRVIKGEAAEFGLRDGFVVPIALFGGLQLAFSFGTPLLDTAADMLGMLTFVTNVAAGHLLEFYTSTSARAALARPAVTCRERDCLLWAAEGKTDWEIGVILGISVPTVRKHLASARGKLQAVNKYHAVAIGMRTGLLG